MLIQIIVVHDRLRMTRGEIASQIAHAQTRYISSISDKHSDFQCVVKMDSSSLHLNRIILYQRWIKAEEIEIVVKKGNMDQIMRIMGNAAVERARSYLSSNIISRISQEKVTTCVLIEPLEHDMVNELTKDLEDL